MKLFILLLPTILTAQTLTWNANTESDLAGYKVYSGSESHNYQLLSDVGNSTIYSLAGVTIRRFLAVTAYDQSGNESMFSEEVVYIPEQMQKKQVPPIAKGLGLFDVDTVLVNDTLKLEISQEPLYDEGSQFNPQLIDSIAIHVKRVDTTSALWQTIVKNEPGAPIDSIKLSAGLYKLCTTTFVGPIESACSKAIYFRLLKPVVFTTRTLILKIPLNAK